ncbi:hypothetical protein, partial [Pseudomonas aeruginosa]|uniref:hypothetical protein n=1 Tax=Pseudomonas aeruginosa TaxID=287 RepID=UPI001C12E990
AQAGLESLRLPDRCQCSRAADERRVVLGHAMEGAEIISASMFSLQLISGLQRHEYGYDAEIIHR